MKENERIAGQYEKAFEGGAWHGPSVLELVRDISAAESAAHPISEAHSIWELALHIEAWERA
ncbi:MAG TPA: hypothetical protein VGW36_07165, partial [Pyrinomonadaceae bacterium]|nr:hypothetical protein [Pyrinomonadaceae bacterium]